MDTDDIMGDDIIGNVAMGNPGGGGRIKSVKLTTFCF